jgi:two-component system, OmpR family, phosphate regulon sensor histidine kinase PhoR
MLRSKWFFHPLFVFIFSIIALGTSLFIYISSYLKVNDAFKEFVLKHNTVGQKLFDSETWVMILITSILVAIIITGLAIIFVYYQKMINLYRKQQNFINGFTHELKTPVASLQLLIDTFIKHELEREQQLKYLKFMQIDTKRISENVNQILNLANIEEKKHLDDLYPRDISDVIEEFLDRNKEIFENHELTFLRLKESLLIPINLNLFDMMIMNIITNALRYNENEFKKIKIKLQSQTNQLSILISDNGIGIKTTEIKNVFKKFYQIGESVKGTGLGLYLVSNIMRLHKGKVKILSQGLGEGITVKLDFRLRKSYE